MVGPDGGDARAEPQRMWNIDGLIPREAWEDRTRDGGLGARLETLERRLHAAIDRVEDVPAALERRLEALESQMRARDEELEAIIAALERMAGVEVPARLSELAGALTTFEVRVEKLGGLVAELAAVVCQIREGAAVDRHEQEVALRSVEARLVATVQATADALVADAADVVTDARTTGVHLDRLAGRLENLDRVLAVHRGELTDVLVDDRRALTEAVVERMVAGLRPRARRRVANDLLEGRQRRESQVTTSNRTAGYGGAADRLRALVEEVSGVGPARADALVAAFGTAERLGVCDVAEVVAFAGIPESVAADVLERVRRGGPAGGDAPAG